MCVTSTIAGETRNKGSDPWSRRSCPALIHQLRVSTKSSRNNSFGAGALKYALLDGRKCQWGGISQAPRLSVIAGCGVRESEGAERGEGRTGALKHDLLDLAGLELAARASLISRVIPFGHKLVRNGNVWMTSRRTQRIMKSLDLPNSSPTHSHTPGLKSFGNCEA